MLDFDKGNYGLGVGYYKSILGGGKQAVGHGGGNIGTTASMIYSRKHHISQAVMINSFNGKCISSISEKFGKKVLRSLSIISISPSGFIIIGVISFWIIFIIIRIRRKRKIMYSK
jgi:hypothetical protein